MARLAGDTPKNDSVDNVFVYSNVSAPSVVSMSSAIETPGATSRTSTSWLPHLRRVPAPTWKPSMKGCMFPTEPLPLPTLSPTGPCRAHGLGHLPADCELFTCHHRDGTPYSAEVRQRSLPSASSHHPQQHTELAGPTAIGPPAPLVRDEGGHRARCAENPMLSR